MALPAIGELNQRIDLCGEGEAANVSGGVDKTHPVIASVWAKVAGPPRATWGTAYQDGEQVEPDLTQTIIVRGRDDMASVKFVSWKNRLLRVRKIRDLDPMLRFQMLLCEEQSGL